LNQYGFRNYQIGYESYDSCDSTKLLTMMPPQKTEDLTKVKAVSNTCYFIIHQNGIQQSDTD